MMIRFNSIWTGTGASLSPDKRKSTCGRVQSPLCPTGRCRTLLFGANACRAIIERARKKGQEREARLVQPDGKPKHRAGKSAKLSYDWGRKKGPRRQPHG